MDSLVQQHGIEDLPEELLESIFIWLADPFQLPTLSLICRYLLKEHLGHFKKVFFFFFFFSTISPRLLSLLGGGRESSVEQLCSVCGGGAIIAPL